ncbi:hypothetical protein BHE74_00009718, partial [Ensete ventricosum]
MTAWFILKSRREGCIESTSRDLGASVIDPMPVIQWSFLAVCLFFYTGHWCTFDGLRYGAAFVGFDHFNIMRQGLLDLWAYNSYDNYIDNHLRHNSKKTSN